VHVVNFIICQVASTKYPELLYSVLLHDRKMGKADLWFKSFEDFVVSPKFFFDMSMKNRFEN
jgi:hypothetical protein